MSGERWFRLAQGFWRSPRFLGASDAECATFVKLVSYCYEHGTDGRVPRARIAAALGGDGRAIAAGLRGLCRRNVVEIDDDFVIIRGYLDHNPSAADLASDRAKRSAAGRTAAVARHANRNANRTSQIDEIDKSSVVGANRNANDNARATTGTTAYRPPIVDRCRDCGMLEFDCRCST